MHTVARLITIVIEVQEACNCNSLFIRHPILQLELQTMADHHTRDNPDLQNIIPEAPLHQEGYPNSEPSAQDVL